MLLQVCDQPRAFPRQAVLVKHGRSHALGAMAAKDIWSLIREAS